MHRTYVLVLTLFFLAHCDQRSPVEIDLSQLPTHPELFAKDVVSTHLYERDMAIAPDGQEFIYTLGDYKQRKRVLVRLQKNSRGWSDKAILSFSGVHNDIEPFYSPDGTRLFFASDRPLDLEDKTTDYNIWVSEKVAGDWGHPVPLDTVINSAADEYFPAVASNGNLYFTTTRKTGIGREDIFMSKYEKGKYQVPQPLDTAINSPLYEFNAFVSADEKLIIFTSYARSDDLGGGDLYFSTKDSSGKWRMAKNLGPEINSTKLDYCPFMYTANSGFYFTSERDQMDHDTLNSVADFEQFSDDVLNGLGNIYHVNAKIFATSN